MKTETHTVTIPIADYKELLKAGELIGVSKLNTNTPMWQQIDYALRNIKMQHGGGDIGIPNNIELYFKSI